MRRVILAPPLRTIRRTRGRRSWRAACAHRHQLRVHRAARPSTRTWTPARSWSRAMRSPIPEDIAQLRNVKDSEGFRHGAPRTAGGLRPQGSGPDSGDESAGTSSKACSRRWSTRLAAGIPPPVRIGRGDGDVPALRPRRGTQAWDLDHPWCVNRASSPRWASGSSGYGSWTRRRPSASATCWTTPAPTRPSARTSAACGEPTPSG